MDRLLPCISVVLLIAACLVGGCRTPLPTTAALPGERPIPVLYSTDLLHPYDDPDDHYDIATLLAIRRFDVRGVVLDLGERQRQRPGRVALVQLERLTGRRLPHAVGLSGPLRSTEDPAVDRPAEEQAGVELMLSVLRESPEPVTIITTGSLRDLAAAWNRDPDLLRRRVSRLYVNAGSTEGPREWNTGLDVHAYRAVMSSGLPIYWCPCLPMSAHRHSTYWKFRQDAVLEALPTPLLRFFVYALQRVPPAELEPLTALERDLQAFRHLPGTMERNMWCTASFLHAAGWEIEETPRGFAAGPAASPGTRKAPAIFSFEPVQAEFDETGCTRRLVADAQGPIHLFTTENHTRYQQAMTDCLRHLLVEFPLAGHTP